MTRDDICADLWADAVYWAARWRASRDVADMELAVAFIERHNAIFLNEESPVQ